MMDPVFAQGTMQLLLYQLGHPPQPVLGLIQRLFLVGWNCLVIKDSYLSLLHTSEK